MLQCLVQPLFYSMTKINDQWRASEGSPFLSKIMPQSNLLVTKSILWFTPHCTIALLEPVYVKEMDVICYVPYGREILGQVCQIVTL